MSAAELTLFGVLIATVSVIVLTMASTLEPRVLRRRRLLLAALVCGMALVVAAGVIGSSGMIGFVPDPRYTSVERH